MALWTPLSPIKDSTGDPMTLIDLHFLDLRTSSGVKFKKRIIGVRSKDSSSQRSFDLLCCITRDDVTILRSGPIHNNNPHIYIYVFIWPARQTDRN